MSENMDPSFTAQFLPALWEASRDAFEVMLGCAPLRNHSDFVEATRDYQDVSSVIGLTGEATGAIRLSFPRQTACAVVERLLDLPTDEIDDLVRDSMCELANIIGGGTKDKMRSLILKLGLPRIVQQDTPLTEFPRSARPKQCCFQTELGPMTVACGFVSSSSLRILVIDPDRDVQEAIANASARLGFPDIWTCERGTQALELVQTHPVDLVLMREELPDWLGGDLVWEMRKMHHQFPVVLLTEPQTNFTPLPVEYLAASDHLALPLSPGSLQQMINKWMSYPLSHHCTILNKTSQELLPV